MGLGRGAQTVVTGAVFNALALLFIVIRGVSRFIVTGHPGPEDYFIVVAWVLSVGSSVTIALQTKYGLGRHVDTVSATDAETLSKLLYASIILYNYGLFFVKGSILHQYLRFFVERKYKYAAWFLIGLTYIGGTTFILASCFACTPVSFFWDKSIKGGHCVSREGLWFSFSGFNIATDFLIWLLPMPVLWKLQLPKRDKISLIAVFALGGFACLTGIVRLHSIYVSSTSPDYTYVNFDAVIWSTVELNVAIMCACIPTMRPVLGMIFPRLLPTSVRERSNANHYAKTGTYIRNESVVELSQAAKPRSEVSKDDAVSFDHSTDPSAIRVKNEWTITAEERV